MKLKIANLISGICFLLSSLSLLYIPFLNLEDEFPTLAYFLAATFWGGLIIGIAWQIFLGVKCKKRPKKRILKMPKLISLILFGIFFISGVLIVFLFNENSYALPINLSAVLLAGESHFIIKRMECL